MAGTEAYVDTRYPLSDLTGRVIAAAQEIHYVLGPGFREVIYQRVLALELPRYNVEHAREVWMDVAYKGVSLGKKRVDFVVGDESGKVMLEIKAKGELEKADFVQALSYLKASGYHVGLLINFGSARLEIKRLAN